MAALQHRWRPRWGACSCGEILFAVGEQVGIDNARAMGGGSKTAVMLARGAPAGHRLVSRGGAAARGHPRALHACQSVPSSAQVVQVPKGPKDPLQGRRHNMAPGM